MGTFSPDLFRLLAEKTNFTSFWDRKDKKGNKIKMNPRKTVDLPKSGLSGSPVDNYVDLINFKEAVYAVIMMRAARKLQNQIDSGGADDEVTVNLTFTFTDSVLHPTNKVQDLPAKVGGKHPRPKNSEVDTIISDDDSIDDVDVWNLLSHFYFGHFALACAPDAP